ncbi:MAG TPA: hypothetical protein VGD43_01785 [Micromonospora sp.]
MTRHTTLVDLYLGETLGWVDIREDVRQAIADSGGGTTIVRRIGVDPDEASLVITNTNGRYSPRQPLSPYYGLLGRNTPVRIGVLMFDDDFDRTVATGWGTGWSSFGAGGTVTGTDASVSAGSARHSVPLANAFRASYYTGLQVRDCEVTVTVDTDLADITGAALEPANILLRLQSITDYYMARVEATASEEVRVSLHHSTGGVIAAAVTVAGLVWAGQPLQVRASCVGPTLAVKAWDPSGGEPRDWQLTAVDTTLTDPGYVGIRSGVAVSNTNTKPVIVRYDDLVVLDRRAHMEVASWPPRWNVPGTDAWVEIEAAGILRRLGQGARPLRSALYRETVRSAPTAYWPLEDAAGSLSAASAVDGVADMNTFGYSRFTEPGSGGTIPVPAANLPVFASGDGIPGSAPVIDLSRGGVLQAAVPGGSVPGWQIEWVMIAPRDKADNVIPIEWSTDGTWDQWQFQIGASSTALFIGHVTGGITDGSTSLAHSMFDGLPHHYMVEAYQVAGITHANLYIDGTYVATSEAFAGTLTGTPGSITRVIVNPLEEINGTEAMPILGHVAVWNPYPAGTLDTSAAATGWAGETAADRITRLCAEEDVPVTIVHGPDDSAAMGPQRPDELLTLLDECVDADGGLLIEARDQLALTYRTLSSLYNQTPLAIPYTRLVPPLVPVDDDELTRNDVTVTRPGSSQRGRSVQEAGPLSIQPPPDGVGTYNTEIEVNVGTDGQLGDQAGWRLHLGTWDEARYPRVRVNLSAPEWAADAAGSAAVAAVDAGTMITLTGLPAWLPPDPPVLMAVGSVEFLDEFERTLDFTMVPGGPYTVAEADGDERVPADGSTLAAGIDADDLTLSLASTTANGPWTTDAADFPIDLRVGGERVTASGITGGSSPQTVTLSARGVNGVARSWPAGTEVDVWEPAVVPL